MLAVARIALTALIAVLLYNAYRHYTYEPGAATSKSLSTIVRLADELNASQMAEVHKLLDASKASGNLDVARLRQLLTPAAKRAGELANLERELGSLVSGRQQRQERIITDTRPTKPSPEPPSPQQQPYRVSGRSITITPDPVPLPDLSWNVASAPSPEQWHKAIPTWAGSQESGLQKWYTPMGAQTFYGSHNGMPFASNFASSDPDERELARIILAHTLREHYKVKFGSLTNPGPNAPTLQEFSKEFIKGHYRDSAAMVLRSN